MAKGVRGQQRLYARSVYPRKQKTLTNAHGAVSLSVILHKKLSEEHFVFSVLRTVFIDYLCSSSLVRQPHLIVDKLGSTFESARNILCFYINGKSNRLVCNSPSVSFAASYPQFGIVISRHSRARLRYSFFAPCTPSAARCSGVADSASLHVLTPPAASRPSTGTVHAFGGPVFRGCGFRFASCPHPSSRFAAFDYYGLFHPTIGNSCLAALPLASLLCALDFRFACFAHCARRSSVPLAAPPLLPPYTGEPFKSHHTAWWVVPSLLGYVCIWAPCTSSPPVLRSIDPCCLLIIE